MRALILALTGLALVAAPAEAKYIPTPLHDMLGASDLIVTGRISEVRERTFVLQIEKLVAGEHEGPTVEVRRFQDWACARRWAPYATGQQVLLCLFRGADLEGQPAWLIRSGGGEGEMPIHEDEVYYRHGSLPVEGNGRYELHGGELFATKLPLPALLRTIRAYRRLYAWELDRSTPTPRVVGLRRADADGISAFAEQGALAAWLIEQTEASSLLQE